MADVGRGRGSRTWSALIAELYGKLSGMEAEEVRYEFDDLDLYPAPRSSDSGSVSASADDEDTSFSWKVSGYLHIRPRTDGADGK